MRTYKIKKSKYASTLSCRQIALQIVTSDCNLKLMSTGLYKFIKKFIYLGYARFDHIYLNRFYYHLHSNCFQSH